MTTMKIDVVELGVADAQRKLIAGEFTSRQLTQAYLDRIAAIDRAGPTLNSVIELNPAALDDADRLDAERAAGKTRGPLHGIPVLLKDNIDIVGMVNSAGLVGARGQSPAAGRVPRRTATRRGCRDPRQNQLERMGQLPFGALDVRLEQPRRPDAQSVRARSQSMRFERGHRRRNRSESRNGRRRHRNRRQHHLSGGDQRTGRSETDRRSRESQRDHSDLGFSGHRRADGTHRRGRRGAAQCADVGRSDRSGRSRGQSPYRAGLPRVPERGRARGQTFRPCAQIARFQRRRRCRRRACRGDVDAPRAPSSST